jgi:hypothetical protein
VEPNVRTRLRRAPGNDRCSSIATALYEPLGTPASVRQRTRLDDPSIARSPARLKEAEPRWLAGAMVIADLFETAARGLM